MLVGMSRMGFGWGAVVGALGLGAACGGEPGIAVNADVLLVIIDTLRADGLSCYGNPRATSPNIDAFAALSARFDECLAQAPNTATSHATLFTGLHPWTHRVANLTSLEDGTPGLPPAFETLAERFQGAGYQTAAFTDGGPLGRTWNLTQGFEILEARYEGVQAKVDQVLAFLDARSDERPLFLLVHTYQVHLPYAPPGEWVERFAAGYEGPLREALAEIRAQRAAGGEIQPDGKLMLEDKGSFDERDWEHLRALYDAEIGYTDHELARLLDVTQGSGVLANAVVAITSDHGEEFREHGRVGHVQLYRETLRVPLILRLPDGLGRGRVVGEPTGLIDVFATLLEAAGIAPPAYVESRSLLPTLRGERVTERPLFAETTEHLYARGRSLEWRRSVRASGSSYLSTRAQPDDPTSETTALFDLEQDPLEERDRLGPSADARSEALAREVARLLAEHLLAQEALRVELGRSAAYVVPADDELARELRALGYTEQ